MQNLVLVDGLNELAKKKGCKPGQLALAWVHHQGDDVFPIPGTKTLRFVQENIAAFDIKLSEQEMTELEEAVPHAAVSHWLVCSHLHDMLKCCSSAVDFLLQFYTKV